MAGFCVESWRAAGPGLTTPDLWLEWLREPYPLAQHPLKFDLKAIPTMQRRRFGPLGKCVASAVLQLFPEAGNLPAIYASRHGDTSLTLSLLQGIGDKEPMSPTSFSLAVHNAFSGLLSIARSDISPANVIAAKDGLVAQAFFESVGLLSEYERVLCVIYDMPLPELYQGDAESAPFPFALAMVLGREGGDGRLLSVQRQEGDLADTEYEPFKLMRLISGVQQSASFASGHSRWCIHSL